jgi:hypothetical protein
MTLSNENFLRNQTFRYDTYPEFFPFFPPPPPRSSPRGSAPLDPLPPPKSPPRSPPSKLPPLDPISPRSPASELDPLVGSPPPRSPPSGPAKPLHVGQLKRTINSPQSIVNKILNPASAVNFFPSFTWKLDGTPKKIVNLGFYFYPLRYIFWDGRM